MGLHCVYCGKLVDGHSDGQIYAEMRKISRSKILRLTVRVFQVLGVVKRK